MTISIIVAVGENNVIGKDNQLLWHLPADLKYFKKLTMGYPIIMGRKTYESIGRPLPGRISIIITRNKSYKAEGCIVVNDLESALNAAKSYDEAFIIGGAQIYRQALACATKLYLTKVHASFEGDVFFPDFGDNEWELISTEDNAIDEKNKYPYTFLTFIRKGLQ